ncbi:MAG: hypothetical protein WCG45_03180 [bacterium]
MYINVLCPDKDIIEAREKAKDIAYFSNHTSLTIPVSEEGNLPVTHWYCTFDVSQELYEEIKAAAYLSIVEIGSPKEFLNKHNLRIIKMDKVLEAKEKGELTGVTPEPEKKRK